MTNNMTPQSRSQTAARRRLACGWCCWQATGAFALTMGTRQP